MKNFPVNHNGREYWISRSIAVVVKLIARDNKGDFFVLAVKRGEGTPDPEFVGTWCLPCGYLDFDETLKEAAARELFEETGIKFSPEFFHLTFVNDNPLADKRQNVTFRFELHTDIPVERLCEELTDKNSEKDEVSQIMFINTKDVNNYKWAFNHDRIITE